MRALTSSGTLRQLDAEDLGKLWPKPNAGSDKYSRGVLGIDTGSERYPGAAVLSTLGALNAGAAYIRFCGTTAAHDALLTRCPSVTFGSGRVQAWVIGCGWDDAEFNVDRFQKRIADGVPLVIDAEAITTLDVLAAAGVWKPELHNCLLTPHAGELARLLGLSRATVEKDPLGAAWTGAKYTGATVLLKGATQYCVKSDGNALLAVPGPAWTAQAGSGDVLAGIAGTLLAAGLDAQLAGALAASAQAITAASYPGPYPPDRLAELLPGIIGR